MEQAVAPPSRSRLSSFKMTRIRPTSRQLASKPSTSSSTRMQQINQNPAADLSLATLSSDDLQLLVHSLPKPDLHRHLEGAFTAELLLRVDARHSLYLPTRDHEELSRLLTVGPEDKTLLDFLRKFDVIGPLFTSPEVVRVLTEEVIVDAAQDNVYYLELRFSPSYIALEHSLDQREVMQAVIEGVERGRARTGLPVNLIAIIERQKGQEHGWEMVRLLEEFGPGVIKGVDLANDEFNYPPAPYAGVFQALKEKGYGITVHAGEAGPAENIKVSVLELKAERGGHFVRAFQDEAVEELLKDRGTVVELCRTSNEQTGAIEKTEEYPLRRYLERGLTVTINTDDPAVSGITLSSEYERCIREFDLTWAEVQSLIINGIEGAFVSEAEKAEYMTRCLELLEELGQRFL